MKFGDYIRNARLDLQDKDRRYSMRQIAFKVGIEPSYLSKVERGLEAPPSVATITRLADALGENIDILLALAGKVSPDLTTAIVRRPALFSQLIRELNTLPDQALTRITRDIQNGEW